MGKSVSLKIKTCMRHTFRPKIVHSNTHTCTQIFPSNIMCVFCLIFNIFGWYGNRVYAPTSANQPHKAQTTAKVAAIHKIAISKWSHLILPTRYKKNENFLRHFIRNINMYDVSLFVSRIHTTTALHLLAFPSFTEDATVTRCGSTALLPHI